MVGIATSCSVTGNFAVFCLSALRAKEGYGHIGSTKKGGVRFKVGGAHLNFEVRLRGEIIILKIKNKYHENQR